MIAVRALLAIAFLILAAVVLTAYGVFTLVDP